MYYLIARNLATGLIAALALSPVCMAQSQVAGDWQGTLNAGGTQFRIAWHVTAAKDGTLTATVDNLDQGIYGVPVKAMTVNGATVTQTVDTTIQINGESHDVRGSFEGTIDKDGTEIKGTWTQTEPEEAAAEMDLKHVLAQAAIMPAALPSVTGDWQGTLSAGGNQLRIGLHITAAKDGSLTATFDSIDQGVNGVPITVIALNNSKLTFTIDSAHVTYEGTVNQNATEIDGSFTQGQSFPLDFKRAAPPAPVVAPKPAPPSDIDGSWTGILEAGATRLNIVFRIVNTADGLTAQMQSPDQSPIWANASSVVRKDSALTISFKGLGVEYEGKISADLSGIDGTFTQNGYALQLNLKRAGTQSAANVGAPKQAEQQPRGPQNPVKPYPYHVEDVNYSNPAAGNTLAATLTVPPGKGPFPAVLLISGSGPNDRDATVFGHKPFWVLSDYLTRKGIVVLRADKRGIGLSTGNILTATTADFASDAEAGVAWLKLRPEVDQHKIGLVGHSEGGIVAPMAAVADRDVAFIVLMAGSGVPGDQIIVEQGRLIEEAAGAIKEKVDQDADAQRALYALLEKETDEAALEKALHEQLLARGVPEAQVGAQVKALTSPWVRFFISYDPAAALRKLTIPVLAINGTLDLQVPPAQNLPVIRKSLEEAGNKQFEVDELPGLNHLFQTVKTGAPSEYGQIEETMSPVAMEKVASWILKQ
jgi:fermentation-respiration switch protein FrsA (DUF1100 family)